MLNLSGKLRRLTGGNISLPLSLTRARYREPGKRSEAQVRLPPGLIMLCTKPSSLRSCAARKTMLPIFDEAISSDTCRGDA